MDEFEYFSAVKLPKGTQLVMRLDGKSFHSITEKLGLQKPFDKRLSDMMAAAVARVMECNEFTIVFAYLQSDEISVAFKTGDLFKGRVEKLDSILSAYLSVEFNKELIQTGFGPMVDLHGLTPVFDARVIVLPTRELVKTYFQTRQENCKNNALHSYCYYSLRQTGHNQTQAEQILNEMKRDGKKEMLRVKFGIIFDEIPLWQRFGTVLYFELFTKQAVNQKTQEPVEVTRKRILIKEADDFLQDDSILSEILNHTYP